MKRGGIAEEYLLLVVLVVLVVPVESSFRLCFVCFRVVAPLCFLAGGGGGHNSFIMYNGVVVWGTPHRVCHLTPR